MRFCFVSTLTALVALLAGRGVNAISDRKGQNAPLLSPGSRPLERFETASLTEETGKGFVADTNHHGDESNAEISVLTLQQRGADTAEDVTEECVAAHNEKRVGKLKHPLIALRRNSDAINQAMKYMREVVGKGCPFEHSGADGFGENLYATSGPVATCSDAVGAWYNEIRNFNGKYPGGNWTLESGHFTQVMWAESTGLGCARTVGCPNRILVCNYTPPGNYAGVAPFSREVWESIMENSGDHGSAVVTSASCIIITLVASIASLAVTVA